MDNLSSQEILEKLEEGQVDGNLAPQIESACVLLSYLTDALHAINTSQTHCKCTKCNRILENSQTEPKNKMILIILAWRSISPTWESPSDLGFDFEYNEEQQDEEDTSADDSVSYYNNGPTATWFTWLSLLWGSFELSSMLYKPLHKLDSNYLSCLDFDNSLDNILVSNSCTLRRLTVTFVA